MRISSRDEQDLVIKVLDEAAKPLAYEELASAFLQKAQQLAKDNNGGGFYLEKQLSTVIKDLIFQGKLKGNKIEGYRLAEKRAGANYERSIVSSSF